MLACPVGRGGTAGSALLGGLQSTFGHTRPEDINPKARRRFTPAAPLPLSCSPALSRRVFEETPSPPGDSELPVKLWEASESSESLSLLSEQRERCLDLFLTSH